jgi:hypothetical protein
MLRRVSLTAAQKRNPVKGIQARRMARVVVMPNSGTPELNSKIEPTAAIAEIQEPNKNTPLLGVTALHLGYKLFI